jgi:hypothetical protein
MEIGARGQLRVSADRAAQMVMAATTGAALSAILQPELFGDDAFALQLREAVIAAVTVADPSSTSTCRQSEAGAPTAAAAAATLKSKLIVEDPPLTAPERQLMPAVAHGNRRWDSPVEVVKRRRRANVIIPEVARVDVYVNEWALCRAWARHR